MSLILGLFLLTFLVLFVVAMVKTATSYLALRRPPIACPACGRHTHVWGKKSTCSRCNTTLLRRPDGTWRAKNDA